MLSKPRTVANPSLDGGIGDDVKRNLASFKKRQHKQLM